MGSFVGKVWVALVEGTSSLGSLWENENLLTSSGEGTFIFPAKYEDLRTDEFISLDSPAQRKCLK